MWQKRLFWLGVILAGLAAVLSIVSTNMNAGGVPADVHPVGALAVAVTALVFVYASRSVPGA
jgi:hypothetical protein